MQYLEILDKLDNVKGNGAKHTARCPAHGDRENSLSVNEGDDHRTLLHCHVGCALDDICQALGIATTDLFLKAREPTIPLFERATETTYQYQNAAGDVIMRVVRTNPKGFYQQRPDGKGGWANDLEGVEPQLYHLPEVLVAKAHGETIFVCEGEKDADNGMLYGCIMTTSPMGAGKWRQQYTDTLAGATLVVIIPDNDKAGREHTWHIATALYGKVATVKILDLGGGEKDDFSDWLAQGNTDEELRMLVAACPPWEPPSDVLAIRPPTKGHHMTDLGNAERFAEQYGEVVRWCPKRKLWLVWTGKVWQWDDGPLIRHLAHQTVRTIVQEMAALNDEKEQDEMFKHARKSEGSQRIEALLREATACVQSVVVGELDRDPWLFNCPNGTVNLRTGMMQAHRREDYISMMCAHAYSPLAEAPTWEAFLRTSTGDDAEQIAYLQRAAGYSLTGNISEQCLFFLYGLGMNGKSTFVRAILAAMGEYGTTAQTELFMAKDRPSGGPDEAIANLQGKRFVAASEIEDGRKLAVVLVKNITGGEAIRASRKYEHEIEFFPTFKVWLVGNHKPAITDTTLAIWRRIRMVDFSNTIATGQQDKELPSKLHTELPGILAWQVRGCVAWYRDGMNEPARVVAAVDAYRAEQDILRDFLDECCIVQKGARVAKSEVSDTYQKWCEVNSVQPVKTATFKSRMVEHGFGEARSGSIRYWLGVRLRHEGEQDLFSEETSEPPPDSGNEIADEPPEAPGLGDETREELPKMTKEPTSEGQPDQGLIAESVPENTGGTEHDGESDETPMTLPRDRTPHETTSQAVPLSLAGTNQESDPATMILSPKPGADNTLHAAFDEPYRTEVLAAWEALGRPPVLLRKGTTIVDLAKNLAGNHRLAPQQHVDYAEAFAKLLTEAGGGTGGKV